MTITRPQLTELIRAAIQAHGGTDKFARRHDLTPTYVAAIHAGKTPGPKVLKMVGVKQEGENYVRI